MTIRDTPTGGVRPGGMRSRDTPTGGVGLVG